ncbi:MAG: proline iminopeptidase-family hydrolase [Gemmatimonadaceae bacterium]
MVTWSVQTLLLALYVIAIICALYITFKAFQRSVWWGLVFLVSPLVFWFLGGVTGVVIAGIVVIGAQIYFVRKIWRDVGRIYVYMVVCWVGISAITIRSKGFIPEDTALASITGATVEQAGLPAHVNETYLPVDGGQIWYRRSGPGTGTPVILVHGGPGFSSYYLKPLEALGADRPVVRYDQLGAGRSTKVIDTTLFTVRHFVAELDSLRSALGYEKVHLVGHSWGTILGLEYYLAHPDRVASLTLGSAALNVPEWSRHTRKLVATLSESSQQVIREREAVRDFDAPDYAAAVNEFNGKYVWLRPMDADLDSTMKTFNQSLYLYMWGPSEFTIFGTLRSYDATRRLRNVKVPTLYTVGEFDEANPATIKRFGALTRGSKVEVIPNAAHITTWDNPDVMLRVVREFLRSVDSTAAATPAPGGGQ